MDPQRRRRSLRLWVPLAPLSLALLAPGAWAAAFQPGVEPDPPTGDIAAPAAPQPVEPLRGSGIQWRLAPWRWGGTLGLDYRALRAEDQSVSQQQLLIGNVDFVSHIWQPWFVQVRLGMGFVASHASGDAQAAGSSTSTSWTGRTAVSVFPASRFPFEFRADVSDSRSGGLSLGSDYRTTRLSLSQGYRPAVGSDNYQLQIDHSVLDSGTTLDTLTTLAGTAVLQYDDHAVDLGINHSDNHRSDSGERTRLTSANARHSYWGEDDFRVESLASWNDVRIGGDTAEIGSDVLQLSTFASWRPDAPAWLPGVGGPQFAGTLRWLESRTVGDQGSPRVQAINGSFGINHQFAPEWRAALSLNMSQVQTGTDGNRDGLGAQAVLTWAPASQLLAGWRYTPSVSANTGFTQTTGQADRQLVGLQASHGVSRDYKANETNVFSLALTQSAGALEESGLKTATALAHGASLSWQRSGEGGGQIFGGISFSDSRTEAQASGHFQLVNLQLSQRNPLSRYASWSTYVTFQASHNRSNEVDVFTGQRVDIDPGWQRFYSASISYDQQRVFGVPRLRGSVIFGANSQPLDRRALGDIEAPREQVNESLEARLDYAVGRLETRLSARVAKVEGRTVAGVQARAQRRF
ncbi:conserved exported hypothetical protein [Rubrivivax sp. A210]|uniref:hypothetical protein n=1 Tax=Rubrivivax sp. A210 TaxID=2772301 RepID=UPI001919D261|nr:hypothetical protein [Rubrivivax sp. A210]CAD5372312.1 conserved exported hypothetical protein [Rubrivivax sp. A210]